MARRLARAGDGARFGWRALPCDGDTFRGADCCEIAGPATTATKQRQAIPVQIIFIGADSRMCGILSDIAKRGQFTASVHASSACVAARQAVYYIE